ncbi:unnamed protein product [Ascophyllum nodosum]
MDAFGDYIMTVPDDLTPGDSYKIRVGLHGTDLYDCSSTFSIVDDIPVPSIEVYVPELWDGTEDTFYDESDDSSALVETSDTEAEVSKKETARLQKLINPSWLALLKPIFDCVLLCRSWKYDDGFGGSFARFNIDLYYCGGGCKKNGNCGMAVKRLCEACPDSSGDELVLLPNPYTSHNYKIRVSTIEGVMRSASGCSPKFLITGQERPETSTPSPTGVHNSQDRLYPRDPDGTVPDEDLPSTPVEKPSDFPDWGEAVEIPEQPACDTTITPQVRYAGSTKRIYVENSAERGGCVTLTDIWEEGEGKLPLYPFDASNNERTTSPTGVWLLTEELYVSDGATLQVHGTSRGGDCDELRILSDEKNIINLRAHGGSFSFLGTKVVSWNEGSGTVDHNHEDGRSYISAVSEVIYDPDQTCDGMAKSEMGEARMDVIDSEIGYLGYHESESYGLVWKVRGFCIDKSNLEVFDSVNVYGDIINSNIHNNYFGMYSYGQMGGNWSYNKMHNNVEYGFDPHDDSDYLTIMGNDVWGNGNHGIIASKRCDHVTISDNHVCNGHKTGLFLHRSSDHTIVTRNHVHSNSNAGLAVLESFYMNVHHNVFKDNLYGIRFSVGAGYNWIHDNIIGSSSNYNLYTYLGSDKPDVPDTTGFPIGNVFWRNYLSGTFEDSIKLKQAEQSVIVNNRLTSAGSIMIDASTQTTFRDNEEETFLSFSIKEDSCFTDDSDSDLTPRC